MQKKVSLQKSKIENILLPSLNEARKRQDRKITLIKNYESNPKLKDLGKGFKFFIRTYGCQSNIRDSEVLSAILINLGFIESKSIDLADLVILNTCAIRENAEEKVFGEIGFLKKQKLQNPNFIFGIVGCMSQEEKVVRRIIDKIDHIDFVLGTHNLYRIDVILDKVINFKQKVIEVWSNNDTIVENLPSYRNDEFKAFVTIMHGCDHFCSYCIVPFTRGKIRSRKKEDIIKEVNKLVSDGYKDITLIGQNVNDYGIDIKDSNYKFVDLLDDVAKLNVPRLRFVTSNPWNFDWKIIDVMKKHNNIMPYIHLPIQSGDETILKLMNRTMKIKDYVDLVLYMKQNIKNLALSTDIIVGFPNETNDQFKNTLKLYNEVQFDNAYTFIYSRREGTVANKIIDVIPFDEKKARLNQLNELVKKYAKINNEKLVGTTQSVLVDGYSKTNKSKLTGYTENWKVVNFNGKAKKGEIVEVKITSANRFSLMGEIV